MASTTHNERLFIKIMEHADIPMIVDAFERVNWLKPASLFEAYCQEQQNSERIIWLAYWNKELAGYVTLKWNSQYKLFA